MLLYVLTLIIGIGISSYAFFEIVMWGGIYFERQYICIDKFMKPQKFCDAISAIHNLFASYVGFVVVASSLILLFGRDVDMTVWFIIGFIVMAIDWIMLYIVRKKSDLVMIKNNILTQWHTQKKISDIQNHEVNMYRGCVRVTEKYPKNILLFLGVMVVMLLINYFRLV